MTYCNRVDPLGELHAVDVRGSFTGNRGIIHDPDARRLTFRRWTTKAWIICERVWRGRQRDVFGRNGRNGAAGWSELFFLDEVTALAAGHRPCFACRRASARDFLDRFASVSGLASASAHDLDNRLHAERAVSGAGPKPLSEQELHTLPDGAVVSLNHKPHAVRGGMLMPWSFDGYGHPVSAASVAGHVCVLITPATTLAVLASGFRPAWHASAACAATG